MKNQTVRYTIGKLRIDEFSVGKEIAWDVFLECDAKDYPEEGILNFRKFLDSGEIEKRAREMLFDMAAAYDENGRAVAVGAVRDKNHLSLLFTRPEYQHRGIGSALVGFFADMLRSEGFRTMTVNAAPDAVGFYRRVGFVQTGMESCEDGIVYVPMSAKTEKLPHYSETETKSETEDNPRNGGQFIEA